MKRLVIVGATSGIGFALARLYLREGWHVGLVGRDRDRLDESIRRLRSEVPDGVVIGELCDVRRVERIEPALDRLLVELGQMDLFLYCAGVMGGGSEPSERIERLDEVVDVNIRGAIHFLEHAAAYFELAGLGQLAAVGSVAGDRGRKGDPVYGASKAALHEYLEGLRHRLHGSGVRVSTIKPGWVRTRMLPAPARDSGASITPERAAELVRKGLSSWNDVFFVPAWWGVVSVLLRLLPRPLYKRLAPP